VYLPWILDIACWLLDIVLRDKRSRFTVEKKNVTMKIERFEDIEAWRLGRKLARKALKMS
jgi:hypothetical protein